MEQEFYITKLGHKGDGVLSHNGVDIYAPFTLPGELISGKIHEGEISKAKIIKPVPIRISPVCRHFKTCGGCQLQHVDENYLADWKIEQVRNILSLEGILPEFKKIITSPSHSRRRASFVAKRTKKGAMIGFHARKKNTIIEIFECSLLVPELLASFNGFKEIVKLGASRKASLRLGVTTSLNGIDINISASVDFPSEKLITLGAIADRYGFARISWNNEILIQTVEPVQKFANISITPPSNTFLQATQHGENSLVHAILKALGPAKNIVDLFAGCGTFTLHAAQFAAVHAVEGDQEMIASLDKAWRNSTGLKTITSQSRNLFHRPLLPDELKKFDAAIIDPPRAGALAQTKELAKSTIKRIAFISCNPATFARDAKILCHAGFNLDWIQVVDQFRWSTHIELAAQFTRK